MIVVYNDAGYHLGVTCKCGCGSKFYLANTLYLDAASATKNFKAFEKIEHIEEELKTWFTVIIYRTIANINLIINTEKELNELLDLFKTYVLEKKNVHHEDRA